MNKNCLICKIILIKKLKETLVAYNKRKFCSHKCYWKSLIKEYFCKGCNKKIDIKSNYKKKYCRICLKNIRKEVATKISKEFWKNHVYSYMANGYRMIKVIHHPLANKRGYVYEHRLMMEKELGRYLSKKEVVHHIDSNKLNNKIENLKLFSTTNEHTAFHLLKGDIK